MLQADAGSLGQPIRAALYTAAVLSLGRLRESGEHAEMCAQAAQHQHCKISTPQGLKIQMSVQAPVDKLVYQENYSRLFECVYGALNYYFKDMKLLFMNLMSLVI